MVIDRRHIQENYETLLLSYAAGILDMAQHFAVSIHLSLSPTARDFVQQCETIGGCLIENECAPAAMKSNSLDNVLAQLDTRQRPSQPAPKKSVLPEDIDIPAHLLECIECKPCDPRWKTFYPGLAIYELPLECRQSRARFIKGQPAAKLPHHEHRGLEITLVLDGAYEDETGFYQRGDLVVIDETIEHSTVACGQHGVMAMVVTSQPVRFHGLARLLNPFIRF